MIHAVVFGIGKLGTYHAQKFEALKDEDVELCAVVDPNKEARDENFPDVPWFADIDDLFAAGTEFDIATVATTTEHHHAIAMKLIEAGKHILVEKPLASNPQQAAEMVEAADAKGVWLAVGQVERYRAAAILKDVYHPLFIECHRLSPFPKRSMDIDVVLDLMIHDIDLMLSIVQSPLESVSASGVAVLTDSADIANARFEFADGCVANLTSSRISITTTRKFRVFANNQYVSLDLAAGEYARYTRDASEPDLSKAISQELGENKVGDALLAEVRDFVEAVRDKRPPLVQGKDGLHAQQVAERVRDDIEKRFQKRAPV